MHGEIVSASNALTARWARDACDGASTALSGAGVWPLLALLSAAAREPGREELRQAAGVDAAQGDRYAREALELLDGSSAAAAALGVWTHRRLPVEPWWRDAIPPAARGELTGDPAADRDALDGWVRRTTAGRLTELPVSIDADTALVLATALSVDTRWREPFDDVPVVPEGGPWAGRDRKVAGLSATTYDVDRLALAETPAGPVTLLTVPGEDDVDVVLCLGEPHRPAGEVLAHAVAAAGDEPGARRGDALREPARAGAVPGVRVLTRTAFSPRTRLEVTAARFDVTAEHDLLKRPEPFGLAAVSAGDPRGHFPGISRVPLGVGQAVQGVTATFSAEGFRAAAVTAVSLRPLCVPTAEADALCVAFDRPFGFLARHRLSGLVLLAGWVADPEDWPDELPTTPMP